MSQSKPFVEQNSNGNDVCGQYWCHSFLVALQDNSLMFESRLETASLCCHAKGTHVATQGERCRSNLLFNLLCCHTVRAQSAKKMHYMKAWTSYYGNRKVTWRGHKAISPTRRMSGQSSGTGSCTAWASIPMRVAIAARSSSASPSPVRRKVYM